MDKQAASAPISALMDAERRVFANGMVVTLLRNPAAPVTGPVRVRQALRSTTRWLRGDRHLQGARTPTGRSDRCACSLAAPAHWMGQASLSRPERALSAREAVAMARSKRRVVGISGEGPRRAPAVPPLHQHPAEAFALLVEQLGHGPFAALHHGPQVGGQGDNRITVRTQARSVQDEGAGGLRRPERCRVVDGGPEPQAGDRPDAGDGHQAQAHVVAPGRLLEAPVGGLALGGEHFSRAQERIDRGTQHGLLGDELASPIGELAAVHLAHLPPVHA